MTETDIIREWLDERATLLHPIAVAWDGSDTLCPYCLPDDNGHGQPVCTGIRSPRWGEWETCRECARTQLAALHGMPPLGEEERHSVVKAAASSIKLDRMLTP